jgi:sulfur relay (sulfurtransferase) complex TusBCD TusD component (DsrE family)
MFEIEKISCFARCQVCGNDASENMKDRIYAVRIMNKYQQGVELHLCNNCCNVLSKITDNPDKLMYGIKMMSIDELEELTNNTKCSII